MPHIILNTCTACGVCLGECPNAAIIDGDPIYKIKEDVCTDCGSCEILCPVDAIVYKVPLNP